MGLDQRLDQIIDDALGRRIVGCAAIVSHGGRRVYERAAGYADREAGIAVSPGTIFRFTSLTKPLVVVAALILVDRGQLSLGDTVTQYLPWFTPPAPDGTNPVISIKQLLSHTSGLSYDLPVDVSPGWVGPLVSLGENLRRYARHPLTFPPGTGWAYGMSIDVLGGVLEVVTGTALSEVVADLVTGPLGMKNTLFGVSDPARLAVAYADASPEPVRMTEPYVGPIMPGVVATVSPDQINHASMPLSGGAGMAGTAGDMSVFLDAIRRGELLSAKTHELALSNQIGTLPFFAPGQRFSFMGALISEPKVAGTRAGKGTVYWVGITGNNWFIDRANQLSVVVCTNTMYEGALGAFRDQFREAVYG